METKRASVAEFLRTLSDQELADPGLLLNSLRRQLGYPEAKLHQVRSECSRRRTLVRERREFGNQLARIEVVLSLPTRTLTQHYYTLQHQHPCGESLPYISALTSISVGDLEQALRDLEVGGSHIARKPSQKIPKRIASKTPVDQDQDFSPLEGLLGHAEVHTNQIEALGLTLTPQLKDWFRNRGWLYCRTLELSYFRRSQDGRLVPEDEVVQQRILHLLGWTSQQISAAFGRNHHATQHILRNERRYDVPWNTSGLVLKRHLTPEDLQHIPVTAADKAMVAKWLRKRSTK